jgi:hypothetical protein
MTTSKELKEQGNRFFGNHQYDEAAKLYTKAIIKDPEVVETSTSNTSTLLFV